MVKYQRDKNIYPIRGSGNMQQLIYLVVFGVLTHLAISKDVAAREDYPSSGTVYSKTAQQTYDVLNAAAKSKSNN